MYKVSEEHEMLREPVKKFVRNQLMPLEKDILDRFPAGQPAAPSDEENLKPFQQCQALATCVRESDSELGARCGVTASLVQKGPKGLVVACAFPRLAGQRTYEVVFEDCRVPETQILGRIGAGFAPMQLRLTVRRLQMGAWCVGMTQRALDMLAEHANQRVTFGQQLADRQAIQ